MQFHRKMVLQTLNPISNSVKYNNKKEKVHLKNKWNTIQQFSQLIFWNQITWEKQHNQVGLVWLNQEDMSWTKLRHILQLQGYQTWPWVQQDRAVRNTSLMTSIESFMKRHLMVIILHWTLYASMNSVNIKSILTNLERVYSQWFTMKNKRKKL